MEPNFGELCYFTMYGKYEGQPFDKGSTNGKSEVRYEKHTLVAEVKLKMLPVA